MKRALIVRKWRSLRTGEIWWSPAALQVFQQRENPRNNCLWGWDQWRGSFRTCQPLLNDARYSSPFCVHLHLRCKIWTETSNQKQIDDKWLVLAPRGKSGSSFSVILLIEIKIWIDWFWGENRSSRIQNTNKLKVHMASVIGNLAALWGWFSTATNGIVLYCLNITILYKSITIKNKAKQWEF